MIATNHTWVWGSDGRSILQGIVDDNIAKLRHSPQLGFVPSDNMISSGDFLDQIAMVRVSVTLRLATQKRVYLIVDTQQFLG